MNYTYILLCADGTLYTGWTNDLGKRLEAHNAGKGAKYTRSRRPVRLFYQEAFETREDAMRRERGLGEEAVIITDGYHQLRAWFFARQAGLSSRAVSSRSPFGMTMVFAVREWLALVKAVILKR